MLSLQLVRTTWAWQGTSPGCASSVSRDESMLMHEGAQESRSEWRGRHSERHEGLPGVPS